MKLSPASSAAALSTPCRSDPGEPRRSGPGATRLHGHQIGAHTRTHPVLTEIPAARAREEIAGSKKALEDRFGFAVKHFCYPYGEVSPAVRDMVTEAGFETAVTTAPGIARAGVDPFLIPRLGARGHSLNFRNVLRSLTGRRPGFSSEDLRGLYPAD